MNIKTGKQSVQRQRRAASHRHIRQSRQVVFPFTASPSLRFDVSYYSHAVFTCPIPENN